MPRKETISPISPRADHFAGEADHRVLQIIEPGQRGEAGSVGRVRHLAGVVQRRRERLLAIDGLPGGERGERNRFVQRIRRGDRHQVDCGILDELGPIAHAARKTEPARGFLRRFRIAVGENRKVRLKRQIEDLRHRVEREGMRAAHETAAHQTDAQASRFPHHRDFPVPF